MFTITFVLSGVPRTIECDPAALPPAHHGRPGSLLHVALHAGIPLEHACGGNCACTTCHVIVRAGAANLSPMSDLEADRVDGAWDVGPDSRLACQAVVTGDVVCEIPAYNRNYVQESGGITLGQAGAAARNEETAKR